MVRFFQFLYHKLRLGAPLQYKVPVLQAVIYILLAETQLQWQSALLYLGLSLVTITGIAGYAYLLNDWADIIPDAKAGKSNAASMLNTLQRFMLLFLFFFMALIPWFFFPFKWLNTAILLAELLLFCAYSFPPFRLKEKAIAGVIADALYAHVVPAVLASLTFLAIAEKHTTHTDLVKQNLPALISITAWQLFLGLRNILLHQIEDYTNDKHSNTQTFATVYGVIPAEKALKLLLGLEVAALISVTVFAKAITFFVVGAYLIFVLFRLYKNLSNSERVNNLLRHLTYTYLDDFYYDWLPVTALIVLCMYQWPYVIILVLHCFLFRNVFKKLFLNSV